MIHEFRVNLLHATAWLHTFVAICGLVVCCMNLRLSSRMWWVIAALCLLLAESGCYHVFNFLEMWERLPLMLHVMLLLQVTGFAAWLSFFGGLAGVFADVRSQIQLLRHMARRESER